jgi:hypothetical protein
MLFEGYEGNVAVIWRTTEELQGYADADGSMAEDRQAISRYAFIIHDGAVLWSAKRQEIVSLSTTKSEYVAATSAAKEGGQMRHKTCSRNVIFLLSFH